MTDHELSVDVVLCPRLLIVDDDVRTAKLFGRMLREEGFEVEVASHATAAIDRLARLPAFDLLITDFHVSGGDGLVIAAHARIARPEMPIFIVTGDPRAVASPSLLDPIEVVTKPVDFQVFVRLVRAVLASYRLATATATATLAGRSSLTPNR